MSVDDERQILEAIATIVVPVFNEKDAIRNEVETLLGFPWIERFQLIIVDDGSTDGTSAILKGMEVGLPESVRILFQPRNRGYGAALKAGISVAETEWIVITDADGSYPNECIPGLVEKCLLDGLDMLVGARTKPNAAIPWVRRFPKWVLRQLANLITKANIPDLNSGLRVFRRKMAIDFSNLICDGFSFTTTITLAALCNGFRVQYEPIEYHVRMGSSKIRPIHDTLNFVFIIVTTVFYFDPLRVLLPLCVLLTGLGGGAVIYQLLREEPDVSTVPFLLLQTGFMMFALAIISDLIVKSRNHLRT